MKNLTRVLAITAILTGPAFAQDDHQHSDTMQGASIAMKDQEMSSMQEHMREMHALMERITAEQDPDKRQQLMQEHMDAMQTGMQMMREDMGGKKMASRNREGCMDMMNERMDMMRTMMEQMKGHQTELKKSQRHSHKKY